MPRSGLRDKAPKNVATKKPRPSDLQRQYIQKMSQMIARRTIGFDPDLIDEKFRQHVTEYPDSGGIKPEALERMVANNKFKLPSTIQREKKYLERHGRSLLFNFQSEWIDRTPNNLWTKNVIRWITYDKKPRLAYKILQSYHDAWMRVNPYKTHIYIAVLEERLAEKLSIDKFKRLGFQRLLTEIESIYVAKVAKKLILYAIKERKEEMEADCEEIATFSTIVMRNVYLPYVNFSKAGESAICVFLNEMAKSKDIVFYDDNNTMNSAVKRLVQFYPDLAEKLNGIMAEKCRLATKACQLMSELYDDADIIEQYQQALLVWVREHPDAIKRIIDDWIRGHSSFINYLTSPGFHMAPNKSWGLFRYPETEEFILKQGTDMTLPEHDIKHIFTLFQCLDN